MIHESEVDDKLAASMIQQAKNDLARMCEPKQLVEDAAQLLGYNYSQNSDCWFNEDGHDFQFDPLDPERGDLMKVVEAAEIFINWKACWVAGPTGLAHDFTKGDYQSLALAVLRAASAVWKARGE